MLETKNIPPVGDASVRLPPKIDENPDKQLDGQTREATMLWQYKLHEDSIFYQRLNFFLVAESMILVAFASLFSSSHPQKSAMVTTGILGCVVTFIWGYVGARQRNVVAQIVKEAEAVIPMYARIRRERPKWFSSTWLLTYSVPSAMLLTWAVLIVLALR
jgi:hypothetical protein